MSSIAQLLSPSEAANRLGISAKALRVYEERGLLLPARTAAGWRAYGPDAMQRARQIVELRALGLTLGQVARVLGGDASVLSRALEQHETALALRARQLHETIESVRRFRADLSTGSSAHDYGTALELLRPPAVAFDLPWPWGGERFEFRAMKPLNFIVGPLGSGKTRLAMRIAEAIADAIFIGLDRLQDGATEDLARLDADPALRTRVEAAIASIADDGGTSSDALISLLIALEREPQAVRVIDMIEQGLDAATQEAVAAHLRRRAPSAPPLFFLTRSSAILDLDSIGEHETIILCPANHSPPRLVQPFRGAPGFEAVATCLAPPDVRARTDGLVAVRRSA